MPIDEGYLTTGDGTRLFFQKVGNGPKIVIVPNGIYLRDDFERFAAGRTLIFYDVRNRGASDVSTDESGRTTGDIHGDVEDLDAVRRHFGAARMDLIGHSYIGLMVGLYAMKYPECVGRVVQIGPAQPHAATQYPLELAFRDGTVPRVFAKLGQMQQEQKPGENPVEVCEKFFHVLREIYVADPAHVGKIHWDRCNLPNELNFMKYWGENINPSIQSLALTPEDFAKAAMPVLVVHGRKDRSAPYGGGRDWASMLPDARLVTVENAAHAPWIEAPEIAFGAMEIFLNGAWPESAERVMALV